MKNWMLITPFVSTILTLTLLSLLPCAYSAQIEDEAKFITQLIEEAKPQSLRYADAQLRFPNLTGDDRLRLWAQWLNQTVEMKPPNLSASDDLLIGFIERLTKVNLDVDRQWELIDSLLGNEQLEVRAQRAEPGRTVFNMRLGKSLVDWCAALEQDLDPSFNPERTGLLSATPPAGSDIIPGMALESIDDPVMRAEYAKLIDENSKLVDYYDTQSTMRDQIKFCASLIAEWVKKLNDIELMKKLKAQAAQSKLSLPMQNIIFPTKE